MVLFFVALQNPCNRGAAYFCVIHITDLLLQLLGSSNQSEACHQEQQILCFYHRSSSKGYSFIGSAGVAAPPAFRPLPHNASPSPQAGTRGAAIRDFLKFHSQVRIYLSSPCSPSFPLCSVACPLTSIPLLPAWYCH